MYPNVIEKGIFYHLYILVSQVYFVGNWTVDVSSNSCNIGNIVEREKTNKEQTQKTTLKNGSQKT